jgi:hypothetical protein
MNEIPETMPWVIESFGSNDGSSDNTNISKPARMPDLESGLELSRTRRRMTCMGFGL